MSFRRDFVWGAATSAYQIEGAAHRDGRGDSVWDVYCRQPGVIRDGSSGETACSHYDLYEQDILEMERMGIQAYRFSISWTRVLPEGIGAVNPAGLDFYDRLVDCLLKHHIQPYITLFHWDLPYTLYQRGGYLNRDFVNWFAEYSQLIVAHFSDRVQNFITFNEPQCFVGLGYVTGEHAPGLRLPLTDTFYMAHHVMMAHGKAVQAMRSAAKQRIFIGYAPTCSVAYPKTQDDIEAARAQMFSCPELPNWSWNVSWWSDPVMLGQYPAEGLRKYETFLPPIHPDDLKLMHQPLDFYAQNLYNGVEYRTSEAGQAVPVARKAGTAKTASQWPITPECLYWGPKFLYERYHTPICITENGMSCHDAVSVDGQVHDPNRIDFLNRYLRQLRRAAKDGVDIRGYFTWSLLDNFEWTAGYQERFGLIYVDYSTQQRIWKDSACWYQNVIAQNGENL